MDPVSTDTIAASAPVGSGPPEMREVGGGSADPFAALLTALLAGTVPALPSPPETGTGAATADAAVGSEAGGAPRGDLPGPPPRPDVGTAHRRSGPAGGGGTPGLDGTAGPSLAPGGNASLPEAEASDGGAAQNALRTLAAPHRPRTDPSAPPLPSPAGPPGPAPRAWSDPTVPPATPATPSAAGAADGTVGRERRGGGAGPAPSPAAGGVVADSPLRPSRAAPGSTPPLAPPTAIGHGRRVAEDGFGPDEDPEVAEAVDPAPAARADGGPEGVEAPAIREGATGRSPPPPPPMPRAAPQALPMLVARAVAEGRPTLRVQLDPPALGQVEVAVRTGPGGRLRATVRVQRPETLERLRELESDLLRALDDAGERGTVELRLVLADAGDDPGRGDRSGSSAHDTPPRRPAGDGAFARTLAGLLDVRI